MPGFFNVCLYMLFLPFILLLCVCVGGGEVVGSRKSMGFSVR